MTKLQKLRIRIGLGAMTCAVLFAGTIRPQAGSGSLLQMTTQERLETEPWWPTMANASLKDYAGSESCSKCHDERTEATAMWRAAQRAGDAGFLKGGATRVQSAPFRYTLAAMPQGLEYSVASGDRTLTQNLDWVIGAGNLGRTFLYQSAGQWQQSEVSFYTRPAALDITTGLGRSTGTSLPAALGHALSAEDARSCFNCHTVHATTSAGLEPVHAEPGVGCEACHGPARNHIVRMAGQAENKVATPLGADAVFDPAKLSPEDSIDFCGSCHRSSADAKLSVTQQFSSSVVRFQPYRLEESKCWRATKDQRLTCVACHNPHEPLERNALAYDRNCLQCHTGVPHNAAPAAEIPVQQGKVCPKATSNCVSCHMPKVPVETMHGEFTDHYIRVAHAGEPLPR